MLLPQSVFILLVFLVRTQNAASLTSSNTFPLSDDAKDSLMELDEKLILNLLEYAEKLEERALHIERYRILL